MYSFSDVRKYKFLSIMACHIICFVLFRFVSFRFDMFRFVSICFVSFRFVSICFVSFRFVSVSFRTLQGPMFLSLFPKIERISLILIEISLLV